MKTMREYPIKICPVCDTHFESKWIFCSIPCIDEGTKRARKEQKVMDLIKENIANEMVILNGFLDMSQKFRDYLAEREEYGVPIEYVEKILPVQSRDGIYEKKR